MMPWSPAPISRSLFKRQLVPWLMSGDWGIMALSTPIKCPLRPTAAWLYPSSITESRAILSISTYTLERTSPPTMHIPLPRNTSMPQCGILASVSFCFFSSSRMAAITFAAIISATRSGWPTLTLSDEICIKHLLLTVFCAGFACRIKNPRQSTGSMVFIDFQCFSTFIERSNLPLNHRLQGLHTTSGHKIK